MNTLSVETALAKKFGYGKLPESLSERYREFFRENIPVWLNESGSESQIFTRNGSLVSNGYKRIVIGDYGAFVEFSDMQASKSFEIAKGQEYRITDERYNKYVKYLWMTVNDGSDIKIYRQKRLVVYADYVVGMYYVSVHEVFDLDHIPKHIKAEGLK